MAAKHKEALVKHTAKLERDGQVMVNLDEYFLNFPDEKYGTVPVEVKVFRFWSCATFMYAGVPLDKSKHFRELLKRAGRDPGDPDVLRPFIPKVESWEIATISKEIQGEYVSVQYDGTTRQGECINVCARWCPNDFSCLKKRLLAVTTLDKAVDAERLSLYVVTSVTVDRKVQAEHVVQIMKDSCIM